MAAKDRLEAAEDLLRLLVRRNRYGVWLVSDDDGRYMPLARRLWPWCEKLVKEPKEP